jgi:DNA-directed RNA polymerase specialized sigma24 family protein
MVFGAQIPFSSDGCCAKKWRERFRFMKTSSAIGINKDSDGALVAAARHGDTQAFEELVFRHQKRVLAVAQRKTNNREDAEDAVQESFHKAFRHIDAFQEKSRFSTWLTRMAMNEAFMLLRRRRKSCRSVLTIRWSPLRKHSLTRAQVLKES